MCTDGHVCGYEMLVSASVKTLSAKNQLAPHALSCCLLLSMCRVVVLKFPVKIVKLGPL